MTSGVASTATTEHEGDPQPAPVVEQPESRPPDPQAEPPVDVEQLVAFATERLIERIGELEERIKAATHGAAESVGKSGDSGPPPGVPGSIDRRAPDSPVDVTQTIHETPAPRTQQTPNPPIAPAFTTPAESPRSANVAPASTTSAEPQGRSLGVEVVPYRCAHHASHCPGHLRVTSVQSDSPATRLRCSHCGQPHALEPGYVIMRINGVSVSRVDDLRAAINRSSTVTLHVFSPRTNGHHDFTVQELQ